MKMRKRIFTYAVLTFLLVQIVGCSMGGSKTAVADFPRAQPDTSKKLEERRRSIEEIDRGLLKGYNLDVKAFSTATSVEEIESYYGEVLNDWKIVDRYKDPSGAIVIKWTKGFSEVYLIRYFPKQHESSLLFTEHAWN